jgi:hypothetical protein
VPIASASFRPEMVVDSSSPVLDELPELLKMLSSSPA